MYGIFGREITKYTFIYGVYIRFWPTLHILGDFPARNSVITPCIRVVLPTLRARQELTAAATPVGEPKPGNHTYTHESVIAEDLSTVDKLARRVLCPGICRTVI